MLFLDAHLIKIGLMLTPHESFSYLYDLYHFNTVCFVVCQYVNNFWQFVFQTQIFVKLEEWKQLDFYNGSIIMYLNVPVDQ